MRMTTRLIAFVALLLTPPVGAQTPQRSSAREIERIPVGAATVTIDADQIRASSARSLPELLAGRVAGLSVTSASGIAGVAPRIQVRGSTGAQGSPEPLLFIDGILMREDPVLFDSPVAARAGRLLPAFMWEIPIEQIERVQVVLGAASGAALEYGAPRGAVLVTTRRPASGAHRVDAFVEATSPSAASLPDNFGTRSVEFASSRLCTLSWQVLGRCTPTEREQWNPVEEAGILSPKEGLRAGVQGTGALLGGSWRTSANFERLQTMAAREGLDRLSFAASYARAIGEALDIAADVRYRRADGYYGPTTRYVEYGLLGKSAPDSFGGFWSDPQFSQHSAFAHDVDQVVVSSQLDWAVSDRLRAGARVGVDKGRRKSERYIPPIGPYWASSKALIANDAGVSLSGDVSYGHTVHAGIDGRAQVSATMLRGWGNESDRELTAIPSTNGSFSQFTATTRRLSLVASERLDFGAGRTVGIGARYDRFGKGDDALESGILPFVDASWQISDARFFPKNSVVGAMRVRAAHGAGVEAPSFDLLTVPVLPFPGMGTMEVKLPHSAETEVGLSADLFGAAVTIELTAFQRNVSHALYLMPAPWITGMSHTVRQGARWKIGGTDLGVTLAPVRIGPIEWRSTLTMSFLQYANSDFNYSEYYLSSYGSAPRYYMEQRTPLGTMRSRPYTFADSNLDGLIDSTEVVRGDLDVPVGNGQPRRIFGVTSSIALGRRLTVGAAIDGKGGHTLFNATEYDRCRARQCRALHDPTRPLAEQARAVAALYAYTEYGFYEDATFVKLRELWVRIGLTRGSSVNGARALELMISGRNLVTWTKYSGFDPEVAPWLGGGLNAGDEFAYPLRPSVSAQVRMAW